MHIILAETSSPWKKIRAHRRRPNHTTAPLPWSLNSILRDLENAKVTTLSPSTVHSYVHSPTPVVCTSQTEDFLPDPEAYRTLQPHPHHHTKGKQPMLKRPPQATLSSTSAKCRLCNNQHPNPWHTTENCPFKDPTFIQNKLIRENIMQHNSLHGRHNKNYSKDMDVPSHPPRHSSDLPMKTARLVNQHIPTLDHTPNIEHATDTDPSNNYYHDIPTEPSPSDDSIINTTQFDIPRPTANHGTTTYNPISSDDDHDHSDLPFDPLQYLQYSS